MHQPLELASDLKLVLGLLELMLERLGILPGPISSFRGPMSLHRTGPLELASGYVELVLGLLELMLGRLGILPGPMICYQASMSLHCTGPFAMSLRQAL